MAMTVSTPAPQPAPQLIAPLWHTAALVALFLAIAASGALFKHRATAAPSLQPQLHPSVVPLYLSALAMEWGLFFYVRKGVQRTGLTLHDLVGARWTTTRQVLTDVSLALAVWGLWTLTALLWDRWAGAGNGASIQTLLPRGPLEAALWVAVSISAGICEELTFRGYFQRQFGALTGHRWMAWLLQAALFGISHGYQGAQACVRIVIIGLLFGALSLWRRSLRPAMLAHAWTDIASGLLGI